MEKAHAIIFNQDQSRTFQVQQNKSPTHSVKDSETGERGESPDFEFVETMHVWQFTCFGVLLDDIQTRRYRGETLMGRSHTILKQYGLTLNKAIFNDVFRINNKSIMNSTPTGKMDSLILCVPFLMILHSKTNAMPKCCCDSNFVSLF